jgi:Fe-S-cluster containining protein
MQRKIELITTYNKKYYDICAKKMIETFIKFWPKDVHLYAYYQEQEPEIFADNLHYIDLYAENPKLKRFVFDNQIDPKKNGMIDGEYNFQRDGVKFSHKVFAQTHRIKHTTADVCIFLDADTCTYFGRPKLYDETGFFMHNATHYKAKVWAEELEKIYTSGEIWTYPLQVDCYTVYACRQKFKDEKQLDLVEHHGKLGKKHPFVNSPLGEFLDHLKGDRKELGHSRQSDFKERFTERNKKIDHWKKVYDK